MTHCTNLPDQVCCALVYISLMHLTCPFLTVLLLQATTVLLPLLSKEWIKCVGLWVARPQPQALSVSQSMWRGKQRPFCPMTIWAAAANAKPIGNRYEAKPDINPREPARRSDGHRDEQTLHRHLNGLTGGQ